MLLEEINHLKRDSRELRRFGLLVGGVLTALGLWWGFRGRQAYLWLLGTGLALITAGLLAPRSLKAAYLVWMALALTLGSVISQAILTVFFFLVMTPLGLLARAAGRDFLSLKSAPKARSYWVNRRRSTPKTPAEFEQQF